MLFLNLRAVLSMLGLLAVIPAWGDAGVTYHGRLLKPDGRPVDSSSVQFLIQIRTPSPSSCLMYQETQVKDLSQASGVFSITINDGSQTQFNGEPFSLEEVFRNHGRKHTFPAGKCSGGNEVSFGSTLGRQISISFNDGTFSGWEPLPSQNINFVPSALESVSVGGRTADQLFRVDVGGVPQLMDPWSPTSYQKLLDLVGNTTISGGNASIGGTASGFTGALSGDVTGGQNSTKVEQIQGNAVLAGTPTDKQVLTWNHSQSRWEPANLPVAAAPDWSEITNRPTSLPPSGNAGGDLSGSTYPNPVIANNAVSGAKIADGGVAFSKIAAGSATGQVLQYENGVGWKAEKLLYTDLVKAGGGSPWPTNPCGAGEAIIWQSATDGFECAPISITETDPNVKDFAKNDPSSDFSTTGNVLTLNTVPIARGGTGAVSQSGAINNLLPSQGSNAGKILQTDGSNVSWADAPASGVTSINGATGTAQTFQTSQNNTTPTFTRTGNTHTLEIPEASTNGVTAGTISYADYQNFSGKQNALGFTPLNPANNLSELTNTTTARTNLGLGTAATKNVGTANGNLVELGVGGKIPASLLPSQSGTYFAQGGNAFGAPAVLGTTDAESLHLQTGGTNKVTILNDGNVGIGTDSPTVPLDIRGTGTSIDVETTGGGRIHLKGNTAGGAPALAAVLHLESNADFRGRGMYLSTTAEEANAAWFVGVPYGASGAFQIGGSSNHAWGATDNSAYKNNAKLFINASGNVGIGTTNPSAKLEVDGVVHSSVGGFRFPDGTYQTTAATASAIPTTVSGQEIVSNSCANALDADVCTVSCPAGKTVVGGGCNGNGGLDNNNPSGNGWRCSNDSATPYTLNVYAICVSASTITQIADSDGSTRITAEKTTNDDNLRFETGSLERMIITSSGNVGLGLAAPTEKLEVAGNIKAAQVCLGSDCRSTWPSEGGGGTVTSVATGTGLTGGPITDDGTISIADGGVGSTQLADEAVTGAKLETVSGLTAGAYGSATQVPAITVDNKGRITAISTNTVSALPTPSGVSGKFLKSDGTDWSGQSILFSDVKNSLGSSAFSLAGCGPNKTVAWSSLTDTFSCQDINNLDAGRITAGTLDAARLPSSVMNGLWAESGGNVSRSAGNVGIGTASPHASAVLDVTSAGKGFLPPRMTTTQRDAISSPAPGLTIYNTTSSRLEVFDGSTWGSASGSGGQEVFQSGSVALNPSTYAWADVLSMTVTTGGKYMILASGQTTSGVPWTYMSSNCRLHRNGSPIDSKGFYYGQTSGGSSADFPTTLYSLQTLVSGDVLKVSCMGSSSASSMSANGWKISIVSLGVSNISGADNMGSHTATQNLNLGTYQLVGNGGSSGVAITNAGEVGIGNPAPSEKLDVGGAIKIGNSANTNDGTIRWTGSDFEGRKGGAWVSMTGTGGSGGGSAYIGGLTMSPAANCTWTTTATSWGNYSANANCSAATVSGSALMPTAGKVPAVRFANLAPGRYMLYLNVIAYVASGGCYFRLTDGTKVAGITNVYSSSGDRVSHIIGEFNYDSAQPSVEFSLQGAVWNGSASCIVANNVPTGVLATPFTFSLYKMDAAPVGSDNMGDHVATQNIVAGDHWISGDGDAEGLRIDGSGRVGIGTAAPTAQLDVNGTIKATAADLPIQYVSSTGAPGALGMFATASCPANYKVIGGGCKVNVTYDSRIIDSSPSAGGTGWACTGAHAYAPTTYTITAHAICLKAQ